MQPKLNGHNAYNEHNDTGRHTVIWNITNETHEIRGHFLGEGGQMKIKLFAQMYHGKDSILLLVIF